MLSDGSGVTIGAMMEAMARSGLPSGTVTFLLTDVEGSTQLWEEQPAAAALAIPRHRELIGAAVDAWRGARPLEQGEGDNVVAAFASATDAVGAAHAAQMALANEPWPDGGVVRVRMALHTGLVEVKADGTYAGAVLNRCARLRALAHGGQVLVSGATADLVADHLDDLELLDLGAHRLRDLSRPERVWQLGGPGLATEHPPLRSLDATPNNLPVQLSSFIGREDDIAQGVRLLGHTRLLSFTGAGGCGKTRLAQRVAGEVVDRFPDGTWWVELAPLAEPGLIAETVAGAIGLRMSAERPAVDVVTEHLRQFPALVVLDNCEHVVGAVARFVDHVLRGCEGTSVLATSREPLAIEGEVTWRVPSLRFPPSVEVTPAAMEQYDAVRLFIDRALQARPNFRVDNDNAPAVAQICHRLDGIPLAIELAAAQTRSLPPERIAAELDDRFRLLTGGSRVALPRQQTLFASVDWSHELLDTHERALFWRLGVFVGGFTLDAAEAVAADPPLDRYSVLAVLTRLVDKSLVQADDESGGRTRFRLLETIRQYALDRLDDAGETAAAKDHHLVWVLDLAHGYEPAAANPRSDALVALDREHPNTRAALDWATSAGRIDEGLRLIAMLGVFWAVRGHYTDARTVIPPMLAMAPDGSTAVARARWAGAYIGFYGNDARGALDEATTALEEARTAGDDGTAARCLLTLGTAMFKDSPVQARRVLTEAVAVARAVGDEWCEADAVRVIAGCYLAQGLHVEALPLLRESFALAQRSGNDSQLAWYHLGLAAAAAFDGDLDSAVQRTHEAVALGKRLGNPAVEIIGSGYLGRYLYELGRTEELRALVNELTGPNNDWGLFGTAVLPAMAALSNLHDHPREAGDGLEAIAWATADAGLLSWAAYYWSSAAFAALDADDIDAARQRAARLEPLEEFIIWRAHGTLVRAVIERRTGGETAEDLAHNALATYIQHEHVLAIPRALATLGGIALDAGSAAESTRLLAAADALDTHIGRRPTPAEQAARDADVARARDHLGDDFEATWDAGAALDWRDAVAFARRARGDRKRPSFGWASLTPTEEKVVALVADARTNTQIAEKLLMGRETVKTHLGHIYTKLGIHSRTELASRAIQRRTSV